MPAQQQWQPKQQPWQQEQQDERLRRMLGPKRLAAALGAARSFRGVARLLLAHRATVSSGHMLAAAARMGELAAMAGRPPAADEHDAFSGAVELAFEMMAQEGSTLSLRDAAALLEAAAAVQHPLSEAQMAAVEAAALQGLQQGESSARAENRLLAALLRLGVQPGERLAAALSPACCRGVDSEVRGGWVGGGG